MLLTGDISGTIVYLGTTPGWVQIGMSLEHEAWPGGRTTIVDADGDQIYTADEASGSFPGAEMFAYWGLEATVDATAEAAAEARKDIAYRALNLTAGSFSAEVVGGTEGLALGMLVGMREYPDTLYLKDPTEITGITETHITLSKTANYTIAGAQVVFARRVKTQSPPVFIAKATVDWAWLFTDKDVRTRTAIATAGQNYLAVIRGGTAGISPGDHVLRNEGNFSGNGLQVSAVYDPVVYLYGSSDFSGTREFLFARPFYATASASATATANLQTGNPYILANYHNGELELVTGNPADYRYGMEVEGPGYDAPSRVLSVNLLNRKIATWPQPTGSGQGGYQFWWPIAAQAETTIVASAALSVSRTAELATNVTALGTATANLTHQYKGVMAQGASSAQAIITLTARVQERVLHQITTGDQWITVAGGVAGIVPGKHKVQPIAHATYGSTPWGYPAVSGYLDAVDIVAVDAVGGRVRVAKAPIVADNNFPYPFTGHFFCVIHVPVGATGTGDARQISRLTRNNVYRQWVMVEKGHPRVDLLPAARQIQGWQSGYAVAEGELVEQDILNGTQTRSAVFSGTVIPQDSYILDDSFNVVGFYLPVSWPYNRPIPGRYTTDLLIYSPLKLAAASTAGATATQATVIRGLRAVATAATYSSAEVALDRAVYLRANAQAAATAAAMLNLPERQWTLAFNGITAKVITGEIANAVPGMRVHVVAPSGSGPMTMAEHVLEIFSVNTATQTLTFAASSGLTLTAAAWVYWPLGGIATAPAVAVPPTLSRDIRLKPAAAHAACTASATFDSIVSMPLKTAAAAGATGSAVLSFDVLALRMAATCQSLGSARITRWIDVKAQGLCYATASAYLEYTDEGLTVKDAIDDVLNTLGITQPQLAQQFMKRRALHDLNAAAQMVWTACVDLGFIGKTTHEISYSQGQASATLSRTVQTVLGNVRVGDGPPLMKLATRSQWQNFAVSFGISSGPPLAWFADSHGQPKSDSIAVKLHLAPAPPEAVTVKLDVIEDCPRYLWQDYIERTALQIPHQYAESCLLPICRYLASGSGLFNKPDLKAQIDADYKTALGILRITDPEQEEQDRTNAKPKEAAAAR
ncbi:MAG: hypothetical protein IAE97_00165 [Chthoniobacterales bacterium]|nr:hypothetical protein [Chthoniobacterales bacterium]